MAEKPGGKPAGKGAAPVSKKSLHAEIGWFIWGLVGLGVLWFFMGGYTREDSRQPYIKPAAPLDSGQTYGKTYFGSQAENSNTKLDLPEAPADIVRNIQSGIKEIFTKSGAITSKNINFDQIDRMGAKETNTQKEYVRLLASTSNKQTINLSGFTLHGSGYGLTDYGINAKIPDVVKLPVMGVPYVAMDLDISAGDQVIISSGKSPIGASFQVNMCSGYLSQFQTFTPSLRKDCPEPLIELEKYSAYSEISCREFVSTLPRCEAYNGSFPVGISSQCKSFVTEKLNYNSCVSAHNNDNNFYNPEWRVFLERTSELWKNKGETIRLVNKNKETVTSITY